MKSTALLLNLYECIYGFALAIVLVASGLAVASVLSLPSLERQENGSRHSSHDPEPPGPFAATNAMTCAGAKADAAMSAVDESGREQGAVRLSPMTYRLNRSTQHRR